MEQLKYQLEQIIVMYVNMSLQEQVKKIYPVMVLQKLIDNEQNNNFAEL